MDDKQRARVMLSRRSLGDQLDAWCEMLAAVTAAVGVGPGGRSPPGAAPSPVTALRVPRPPDVPRPDPRVDGVGGTTYVLTPGHLAGLTLPHTAKPPTGHPPNNKSTRTTGRKKPAKKLSTGSGGGNTSGGTATSKDDRKKHKTKRKGRARSRTQMSPSSLTASSHVGRSDTWSAYDGTIVPRPPVTTIRHGVGLSHITTAHISETESDSSDSDKGEGECVEEDATLHQSVNHPHSPGHLNRRTETLNSFNFTSQHNLRTGTNHHTTATESIVPLHHYRSNLAQSERLSSHGALSQSLSNLTKLPEMGSSSATHLHHHDGEVSTGSTHRHASRQKPISPGKTDSRGPSDAHEKGSEKKKRSKPSIISIIKPLNQEAEKAKFLQSRNYEYSPQFHYKCPVDMSAHKNYFKPEYKLMPLALKVLQNALFKHGTYEKFAKRSGGRELTKEQILDLVNNYLRDEGLEDEVLVKLSPDLVSRACMTRVKGRPLLQVQTNNVHEGWMDGLLRHEIGTHYLRSCNNRVQLWRKPRKRRELDMNHQNPTEEGLASLHSVIFREDPCMWRAAMLYYTVVRASDLSFSALFHDLGKFVKDVNVRWDYCLRAKRGFANTADPGAFTKDQVYLKGALEILKNRKKIDFHALIRLGKVSYRDVDRLMGTGVASFLNTRIPRFMRDLDHYHRKLDLILTKNGLTDADLQDI